METDSVRSVALEYTDCIWSVLKIISTIIYITYLSLVNGLAVTSCLPCRCKRRWCQGAGRRWGSPHRAPPEHSGLNTKARKVYIQPHWTHTKDIGGGGLGCSE